MHRFILKHQGRFCDKDYVLVDDAYTAKFLKDSTTLAA
jgi:hypothetical protein